MKNFILTVCLLASLSAQAQSYFSKLIGKPYPYVEGIYDAVQLPDSGFVCTLIAFDYTQDTNKIQIVRLDKYGNTIWQRSYSSDTTASEVYEIISTSDSCFLFVGTERSGDTTDAFLFKINTSGDSLWMKKYNDGARFCLSEAILPTTDNGYLTIGISQRVDPNTQQILSKQVYAVKMDSIGQEDWYLNYGSPSFDEISTDAIQTSDGGYILVGAKIQPYFLDFSVEGLILKLDPQGNVQWMKTVPSDSFNQFFNTIIPTSDGHYILAGGFAHKEELFPDEPFGEGSIIMKMNEQGNTLWFRRYRAATGEAEIQDLIEQSGNGFIAAGYSHVPKESPSLVKFNAEGDVIWWRNYEYNVGKNEAIYNLIPTWDHGFLLTGNAHPNGITGNNASDGWLLKVDSMGCEIPLCVTATHEPEIMSPSDLSLHPNPAAQSVTVGWNASGAEGRLEIWSTSGVLVQRVQVFAAETSKTLDISALVKGIYFVRLQTEHGQVTKKVVVGA